MATVLEQYKLRQSAWNAQSGAGKLPVDALVPMLELNYRVDVIDRHLPDHLQDRSRQQ